MRIMPIEIYSDATNHNVIRSPGRAHPALVIQLDSFMSMYHQLCEARTALDADDLTTLREELDCLDETMEEFLRHYETVVSEHGLALSTPWPTNVPPRSTYEEDEDA